MVTPEQGADAQRIYVNGFRPISDAGSLYGSLIYRDTQFSTTTTTSEAAVSTRTGRCDMRRDTRYARVKVRIPSATTWTFCAGVEPDVTATGLQ